MEQKPVTDRNSWMVGLVAGGLVGLMVACGFGGAGVYFIGKREYKRVRAGWNLVPVIVYNQDLAAGTKLTFEVVSQRPIPEQFVTESIAKPDHASDVVGGTLIRRVAAGDPVRWQDLADGLTADECQKVCSWVGQGGADKAGPIREALEKIKPPAD